MKFWRNSSLPFLLLLFPCSGLVAQRSLSEKLDSIQKESPFIGFAVARVTSEEILFLEGFGHMDNEGRQSYSTKTIQPIGSISKTFIGLALMKAVEMGRLSLDDPIDRFLPYDIKHPKHDEPILIRHLVTHTSTIRDRLKYLTKAYVDEGEALMPLEEFLFNYFSPEGKWHSRRTFTSEKPGEVYKYSNVASALLAYIIDQATSIPFTAFCADYVFNPLGMDSTVWFYDMVSPDVHSDLHKNSGKTITPYSLVTYPDGGLRTNVEDLSKYLREMMRGYYGKGTLLTKESYKILFSPLFEYGDKKVAVFWNYRQSGLIGHTGGDPGLAAVLYFDPEKDLGRIFMVNGELENKKRMKSFRNIWVALERS